MLIKLKSFYQRQTNKKPKVKSFIIFIFILFLLAGCGQQTETIVVDTSVIDNANISASTSAGLGGQMDINNTNIGDDTNIEVDNDNGSEEVLIEVPTKLELDVDFASQAPFANWDALHKEACEEASMIIVAKYFNGEELDETIMEAEIQKLVAWEEENDYQIDLTAQEAMDILENYFSLSARLEIDVTINRIKYELNQGNLIIVPTAGRDLGNPNFQIPGPIYHMLVIKGYDNDEFITNDVGTRNGDGFKYKYSQLINAIHDWDHNLAEGGMTDEEMRSGERVMIVVEKN